MKTKLLGRWGEAEAAKYLREKGYELLAAGYRTRFGEIDLIARKGGIIAFVEVKLRKNDSFAPAREYVDKNKRERLRITASMWLARQENEPICRFDVIEIYAPEGEKTIKPRINHIKNAF
ncbi:MAG: YraN family protein [Oscillospiraceae bacterium]|jgi:putative endonuclease